MALVGRAAELAAIGAELEVAAGEPRAVFLAGEAGIGKSRLFEQSIGLARGAEAGAAALLMNGRPCRRGGRCLSGRGAGRLGEKRCRQAPNQGIRTVESHAGGSPPTRTDCQVATSSERCLCWVTTAGRSFRGEAAPEVCGCGANNDCAIVPGAVCVGNRPGGFAGCGIACVLPCRFPA